MILKKYVIATLIALGLLTVTLVGTGAVFTADVTDVPSIEFIAGDDNHSGGGGG